MTGRSLAAVLAACAVLTPPAAHGATVSSEGAGIGDETSVEVADESGERNDLRIELSESRVVVRESGPAPLVTGAECRRHSARVVSCAVTSPTLEVKAGRGDDRVRIAVSDFTPLAAVEGGAGDDRLEVTDGQAGLDGGPGRDSLRGGPDDDDLQGGPGQDELAGGPGADVLVGDGSRAGIAADRLDGGPGRDRVDYRGHRRGVTVRLGSSGPAGARGEGDRLRRIESVAGTNQADRLVGTSGPNVLAGGPGGDRLEGLGGADRLDAGRRVVRNLGPDRDVDRLACGPGRDLVLDAGVGDREPGRRVITDPLPRDCESLAVETLGSGIPGVPGVVVRAAPRRAGPGLVTVEVHCSSADCTRRVTLRRGATVIGRSEEVPVRDEVEAVSVRLLRPLPRRGIVTVRVEGSDDGADGPRAYDFVYRLRR